MFTSKSLFVATLIGASLSTTLPSAEARPGATNPFSHPVQSFNWESNRCAVEATTAIEQTSLAATYAVLNPSSQLSDGKPGDPLANATAGMMQIQWLVQGYSHVINAEAAIVSESLVSVGHAPLAAAVETIRAGAVARIQVAGSVGTARIAAAMEPCTGPSQPVNSNDFSTTPTVQNEQ